MDAAFAAIAGSAAAAAASLVGVAVVHARPGLTRASALPLAAFSGGVILGAAFLHLLPESMELAGSNAPGWALAAFFALYVLETHVVRHEHHHAADGGHAHAHGHAAIPAEAHAAHAHGHEHAEPAAIPLTLVAILAFGLHAAFDGLAVGVGFSPAIALGSSATLGVLAHKVPEGMALASLLLRAGVKTGRAISIAAGVALLTPLATALSLVLLEGGVSERTLGRLLAMVAGAFVYVASADLLPEVAHHPRLSRTALMLAGIGVAVAVRVAFE